MGDAEFEPETSGALPMSHLISSNSHCTNRDFCSTVAETSGSVLVYRIRIQINNPDLDPDRTQSFCRKF